MHIHLYEGAHKVSAFLGLQYACHVYSPKCQWQSKVMVVRGCGLPQVQVVKRHTVCRQLKNHNKTN